MTTALELTQEIKEWYLNEGYGYGGSNVSFSRYWSEFRESIMWKNVSLPSGTVSHVRSEGGYDDGYDASTVFALGDQFFEVTGTYTSWDGYDWYGSQIFEVFPVQVTVTEYRRNK